MNVMTVKVVSIKTINTITDEPIIIPARVEVLRVEGGVGVDDIDVVGCGGAAHIINNNKSVIIILTILCSSHHIVYLQLST